MRTILAAAAILASVTLPAAAQDQKPAMHGGMTDLSILPEGCRAAL